MAGAEHTRPRLMRLLILPFNFDRGPGVCAPPPLRDLSLSRPLSSRGVRASFLACWSRMPARACVVYPPSARAARECLGAMCRGEESESNRTLINQRDCGCARSRKIDCAPPPGFSACSSFPRLCLMVVSG